MKLSMPWCCVVLLCFFLVLGPVGRAWGQTTPATPGTGDVDPALSLKVFEEARKLIEKGDLEKATGLLEEWLRRTPKDVTNRRNLIHIYLKLDKPEQAELHLKIMTEQASRETEWWAHLGRVQARLGKLAQGAASLEQALNLASGDIDVVLDLARVHSQRKDFAAARKVLEKALPLGKRTEDLVGELAAVLVNLGEYSAALDQYAKLQRLKPSYATALTMAQVAQRQGKCDEVVDALAQWEKEFSDETPYLLLGVCALQANQTEKAEKMLAKGLEKNEACFECALKLGDLYFKGKSWTRAAELYSAAAGLSPRDHRAYVQLGQAEANQGKHLEASRAFASANERHPKDPDTIYMWGIETLRAGDKGEAWKIWGVLEELDRAKADELRKLLLK